MLPSTLKRSTLLLLCLVAATAKLVADPFTFFYGGDQTPSSGVYADWFTTIGPNAQGIGYFGGTDWSSNGDILTMETRHPNDFAGATSQGIWFGRTDGYGDPSSFNLASTSDGNRVDVRMALGANSSEWSLYWGDASGYGAALYLLGNGFNYYTQGQTFFRPVADMTAFHDFSTQIYNGQVSYFFDGALLTTGTAFNMLPNFLLIGDGSAGDVSGYGTLRIDSMAITINAGAAPVAAPDALNSALGLLGAMAAGVALRRRLQPTG